MEGTETPRWSKRVEMVCVQQPLIARNEWRMWWWPDLHRSKRVEVVGAETPGCSKRECKASSFETSGRRRRRRWLQILLVARIEWRRCSGGADRRRCLNRVVVVCSWLQIVAARNEWSGSVVGKGAKPPGFSKLVEVAGGCRASSLLETSGGCGGGQNSLVARRFVSVGCRDWRKISHDLRNSSPMTCVLVSMHFFTVCEKAMTVYPT